MLGLLGSAWVAKHPRRHDVAAVTDNTHYEEAWSRHDFGCFASGHLEADLQLRRSLMQPEVGGAMRFSRGVAYLNPQGAGAPPPGQGTAEAGAQEADVVAQAFSALQARKEGTSAGLVRQQSRLEAMHQVKKKNKTSTTRRRPYAGAILYMHA